MEGMDKIVYGQVAQLVEQRTENPRVGGSIPPLATNFSSTCVVFLESSSVVATVLLPTSSPNTKSPIERAASS